MSHAMHDHEMVLRSVLRAAAEQLEPAADGLERIKAQLRPPLPVPVAWVCAMWTRLCLRAPDGLWTVTDRIAREFRLASERFMPPAGSHGSGRRRDRLSWLRPVAAMSVVVFIVAAVVYMAIEVPQAISPGSYATNQPAGAHGNSGSSGNGSRNTQTHGGAQAASGSGNPGGAHSPACSGTPRPTPVPVITSSASPPASSSPTQTVSPTATATPTPTPTATATPTPTVSSSPTSGAGGTSGASSSPSASSAPAAGPSAGGTAMNTPAQSTAARPTPTACGSPRPSKKGKATISPGAAALLLLPALTATEGRARTYY